MRIRLWSSVLTGCFFVGGIAAAGMIPTTVVPPEGITYLTVSKYPADHFRKAHLMGLRLVGSRFEFDQIGELESRSFGKPGCRSLLNYGQSFPLSLMLETKYLTPEQAEFQAHVGDTVLPSQVTFTEISQLLPASNPRLLDRPPVGPRRGQVLKTVLKASARETIEVRKSAMWMISGQTLEPARGPTGYKVVRRPLPWQDDPELKQDSRLELDRNRFPIIWEFGRAGQIEEASVEFNLRALTVLAYQELRHLGINPTKTEGTVFIHSLSTSRTKIFERFYKATRFPSNWQNEDNCVLTLRLSDLLKRFPPEALSSRVSHLIALSGGQLNAYSALEILDQNLMAYRNDLDLRMPASPNPRGPVVLEDMSMNGYRTLMRAHLAQRGLSQANVDAVFGFLAQVVYTEGAEAEHYFDVASTLNAWAQFSSRNAVHISNLDAGALTVPDYLPTILRGTYDYYVTRLREQGIPDPEVTVLERQQIRFCVRTGNLEFSTRLRAMGSEVFKKPVGGRWGREPDIDLHFFTPAQIRELRPAQGELTEGYWARRRLLSHPMQF